MSGPVTCELATFDAGGIADVETRSGGAAGSVVTSGLRSSGSAIGSVPPAEGGAALGGRGATADAPLSLIRFVEGPEGLDGGMGRSRGAVAFGGGPTPSDVWFTGDFGRMPDVERFAEAPATAVLVIAGTGIDPVPELRGAPPGRGICGVIGFAGVPAESLVPPPLGGPGRGGVGATEPEPAGRVVRAPWSPLVAFAGDGCRPSRSAKTALIRKLS